jgi:hypothetical protein
MIWVMTDISMIDRATHNGPSIEEWALMGAKATITLTTEISKYSSQGNFRVDSKSKEIASLDLLALADAVSHKVNVGGEVEMANIIGNKLLDLPNAKEVYYYAVGEDHYYTVVFNQDQDDLSNQIAAVQVEAYDLYPDVYFDVRYSISDRFNPDTLPRNVKRISEGE